ERRAARARRPPIPADHPGEGLRELPASRAPPAPMTDPSRRPLLAQAATGAAWVGPWLAVAALALWVAAPAGVWLAVGAAGASMGSSRGAAGRPLAWGVGIVLLLVALVMGFAAHSSVNALHADWDARWAEREAEVGGLLGQRLERRQAAAEQAVDALAEKAMDPTDQLDIDFVRDLRRERGVTALALYDPRGRLIVWDGVHWGKVPEDVSSGRLRHTYHDRPLFGYLYVTALTEDGGVAVSADLLRADLPDVLA